MAAQLHLLICERRDRGSGKCRVSHDLVASLGCNVIIGDYIKIQTELCSFLCSVWPTSTLQDKIIVDPIIMCEGRGDNFKNLCQKNIDVFKGKASLSCWGLTALESSRAEWIEVEVMMSKKQYLKYSPSQEHAIQELVHYLLLNRIVTTGAIVDCQYWPTSNQTITCIRITRVQSSLQFALIDGQTKIRKLSCVKFPSPEDIIDIGGVDDTLSMLKDLVKVNFTYSQVFNKLGLPCIKAVMLQGPSGVGKTLLVKKLAQDLDAALVWLNGADVYASYEGESEKNLQSYFDEAHHIAKKERCILFIDEIDALCPGQESSNEDTSSSEEHLVVSLLVSLLQEIKSENSLFVIGATNQAETVSSCLYGPSKFEKEIYIGIPNVHQRESILQLQTKNLNIDSDVNLKELAEMTCGYVGADLKLLCKEAMFIGLDRVSMIEDSKHQESYQLCAKDFVEAIHRIVPSSRRAAIGTVELRKIGWNDIGGLENIKLKIQQAIEWPLKYPEAFARLGLPRPRGVLLFGPPGCSKTTLVRAAASSCHVTFLSLNGAQLYSPYVGDSERAIRQAFLQARTSSPCILFLDEIDAIVSRRVKNSQNSVQERVLSTLLNEMDGISSSRSYYESSRKQTMETEPFASTTNKNIEIAATTDISVENSKYRVDDGVIVVCATNRPDMLDDALLRPGRMDRIIYVPPPERDERLKILEVHTRCMPLESDVDLTKIADATNLYSGADLENICREAAMESMRQRGISAEKVSQENFVRAAQIVNASISTAQLSEYQRFCKSKLHTASQDYN